MRCGDIFWGQTMKKAISLALLPLLAACTTGTVAPIGKDDFTLSASRCGVCEPVQQYVGEKAAAYCADKGKELEIHSINGNNGQPWNPGTATILFSCK